MHRNHLYCPNCGSYEFFKATDNSHICRACDYTLFQNTATAAGALIRWRKELLVIERGEDPGKGLLDLPGGFIDFHETLEDGLIRELKEELGFVPEILHYIGGYPNQYPYKSVIYQTLDVFFEVQCADKPQLLINQQEVSLVQWLSLDQLDLQGFAFPSVRAMLSFYISKNNMT